MKPYIAIDEATLRALVGQEKSDPAIARALGVPVHVVATRRRLLGLASPFAHCCNNPGVHDKAIRLVAVDADSRFAAAIGDRAFQDNPRIKPVVPAWRPLSPPSLVSGCGSAAFMCVQNGSRSHAT